MANAALHQPVDFLRQAIAKAFPDRAESLQIHFDGNLSQAWIAFARLLTLTPGELAKAVAPSYGVHPAGPLDKCSPDALALLPSGFCQQHGILPLRIQDKTLLIATANPFEENVSERTRFLANNTVQWVLAPPADIEDAIVFAYAKEAARINGDEDNSDSLHGEDNAIVKLGRALIVNAIEQRASDLHIQPYLGVLIVRIRVDGKLRRLAMLPDAVASTLMRHFKVRSGMDSTNTLLPQDGRMSMVINDREFDMRVASLPANRGERLVVRFLDQGRVHSLSNANFSHAALQVMRRGFARPSGMIIMTGPTGSGKTSTLYGMLAEINNSSVNIITVENPVEYRIPGISQVEVNDKAGRTFTTALRSILRQDPDVILIGEIRDQETAEIACQAALTGHLVLSTLHTNDALTAIARLLNLGVPASILADSLAMVIAQRLCRMLCRHCKVAVIEPLTPDERIFLDVTRNRPAYRAVGCKTCNYTGYLGRLPIVDIVEMNSSLRDALAMGEVRLAELGKLRTGGLKSLAASGSLRVISGDTTVSEIMESVGPSFWPELAEHYGVVGFSNTMELAPQHVRAGQGVLFIAPQSDLLGPLTEALEQEGLFLTTAQDCETAHQLLQKDEDIAYIVSEIPETSTLEECVSLLRDIQLHTTWTRLPSAIVLPQHLLEQETSLREAGLLSTLLGKPTSLSSLIKHIRQARYR